MRIWIVLAALALASCSAPPKGSAAVNEAIKAYHAGDRDALRAADAKSDLEVKAVEGVPDSATNCTKPAADARRIKLDAAVIDRLNNTGVFDMGEFARLLYLNVVIRETGVALGTAATCAAGGALLSGEMLGQVGTIQVLRTEQAAWKGEMRAKYGDTELSRRLFNEARLLARQGYDLGSMGYDPGGMGGPY